MTLARKRTKRTVHRATRKPASAAPDTRQMLKQIDTMIRELQIMRRQITQGSPLASSEAGLTDRLFGAAGHGTWDEYDVNLDWQRFSEWPTR